MARSQTGTRLRSKTDGQIQNWDHPRSKTIQRQIQKPTPDPKLVQDLTPQTRLGSPGTTKILSRKKHRATVWDLSFWMSSFESQPLSFGPQPPSGFGSQPLSFGSQPPSLRSQLASLKFWIWAMVLDLGRGFGSLGCGFGSRLWFWILCDRVWELGSVLDLGLEFWILAQFWILGSVWDLGFWILGSVLDLGFWISASPVL